MRLLKKVLKGILVVLLLIIGSVGLILGKEYIESKRIEHIVKSDDGKEAIENMLKINFDKIDKNPMGGINIYLIINNDLEMKLDTTLVKFNKDEKYETGARGISPKLFRLVYGEKR